MGCGCCSKDIDQVAPPHKPYIVPPGSIQPNGPRKEPAVSSGSSAGRNGHAGNTDDSSAGTFQASQSQSQKAFHLPPVPQSSSLYKDIAPQDGATAPSGELIGPFRLDGDGRDGASSALPASATELPAVTTDKRPSAAAAIAGPGQAPRHSVEKHASATGSSGRAPLSQRGSVPGFPASTIGLPAAASQPTTILTPQPRPREEPQSIAAATGPSGQLADAAALPALQQRAGASAPLCRDAKLSPADAVLIAQGSELQGLKIVPWSNADEDIAGNFGFGLGSAGARNFEDKDGLLELSSRQREALHAWRRFPEVVRASRGPDPAVFTSTPASNCIRQGLVGDCSFLSALSVLADYERRFASKFGEPVLSSIIFPRDRDRPVYNEYGQYGCRLFLNGTMRKVVVDDRVPVRKSGQLLCAHSANIQELWVTLLEKSFAKIMGSSYDMQGSNPGTDVFHLTGWVPETIPLSGAGTGVATAGSSEQDHKTWDEIFNVAERGFHQGCCIVCVGTAELADAAPDAEARRLGHVEGVSVSTGLVARHAYPVLDCRRVGRHRLLHLKNPWGRIRWRGRFSPGDAESWREISKEYGTGRFSDVFGLYASTSAADDGHFWIEWSSVLQYFSHLYLCWAPRALGLHALEVHGSWDPEPHFSVCSLPDDTHLVAFNPQFLLRLDEPLPDEDSAGGTAGGVWVLLSRHVRVRSETSSRYVATHIYKGGSRLCCPDAPQEMGVYSNGECAFVRLRGSGGKGQCELVLVVSQHASKVPFNFTLQVYTAVPGTLTPLPPLAPEDKAFGTADGSWTKETAGGCSNDIWAYFQNPHWRIEVPAGGVEMFALFLECPAEFSVNVRLFHGVSAQPELLRSAESSGAYRQGCSVLQLARLAPGPHVAVVSTFRPGLCGAYRLAWHSSKDIKLRPQPHPFAVPLQPPLESLARRVMPGVRTRLRVTSATSSASQQHPMLVCARLQCDFKVGLPPLVKLFNEASGDAHSNPQAGDTSPLCPAICEYPKASYAESYFGFSGAAVMLLAELQPEGSYVLELLTPHSGKGEVAVYINSDGPLSIEELPGTGAAGEHGAAAPSAAPDAVSGTRSEQTGGSRPGAPSAGNGGVRRRSQSPAQARPGGEASNRKRHSVPV